jgi:two-component system, LytTR family, sensor kinase
MAANPTMRISPVASTWITRTGWMIYAAVAVLFGLYLGINQMIGLPSNSGIEPWKPLVWELSSVPVVFALVPLIFRFEKRFSLNVRPRWRTLLIHAGAALVFSALHILGMLLLRELAYSLVGQHYEYGDLIRRIFYELQKDIVTYLTILLLVFASREFQVRRRSELRAAELVSELTQARLSHLTAQIEPHFLFNALNAISNRMHEDVEAADRMISELGSLLRAAYDSDNHLLVPLARELEWLRGYAAMMTERYRGQLTFELNVAPELGTLRVPRLLLQPLVENALRHGLADGRGIMRIDVTYDNSHLHYRISDDGTGITEHPPKFGTGLSNIARRLELLYPGNHRFEIAARQPRGTVASLSFPVAN